MARGWNRCNRQITHTHPWKKELNQLRVSTTFRRVVKRVETSYKSTDSRGIVDINQNVDTLDLTFGKINVIEFSFGEEEDLQLQRAIQQDDTITFENLMTKALTTGVSRQLLDMWRHAKMVARQPVALDHHPVVVKVPVSPPASKRRASSCTPFLGDGEGFVDSSVQGCGCGSSSFPVSRSTRSSSPGPRPVWCSSRDPSVHGGRGHRLGSVGSQSSRQILGLQALLPACPVLPEAPRDEPHHGQHVTGGRAKDSSTLSGAKAFGTG